MNEASKRAIAETDAATADVRKRVNELLDGIEAAWGIIANAGGGDWTTQSAEWQAAAAKWRDTYVLPR